MILLKLYQHNTLTDILGTNALINGYPKSIIIIPPNHEVYNEWETNIRIWTDYDFGNNKPVVLK